MSSTLQRLHTIQDLCFRFRQPSPECSKFPNLTQLATGCVRFPLSLERHPEVIVRLLEVRLQCDSLAKCLDRTRQVAFALTSKAQVVPALGIFRVGANGQLEFLQRSLAVA